MTGDGTRRTVRGWSGTAVALTVALALVSVLAILARTSRHARTDDLRGEVTPTLPASHILAKTWQLAYIAHDGRLHFATLDGSVDRAGPELPPASGFSHSVDTSPDGRYVAYATQGSIGQPGQVIVLDLAATSLKHATYVTIPMHAYRVYMAPDSSRVALDTGWKGLHPIFVVDAHGGSPHLVPGTDGASGNAYNGVIGWLDATHILASALILHPALASADDAAAGYAFASQASDVMVSPANVRSGDGAVTLVALDVTSGERRIVVQRYLGPPPLLTPDRHWLCALASGDAKCIDVRNGANEASQILPHVAAIAGIDSSTGCWQGRLPTLAVTATDAASHQQAVQLLDMSNDSVLSLTTSGVPLLWSPDGNILLLGNVPPGAQSEGQTYAISALSPVEPHVREVQVTSQAVTLLSVTHAM